MEDYIIMCATMYRGRLRGKVGLLATKGSVVKKPTEMYAVMFDEGKCNLRHPRLMQVSLGTTKL